MPKIKYAGIGSRQTPDEILDTMCSFAFGFADEAILRSGGCLGADKAFEHGVYQAMQFYPDPYIYDFAEFYWPWEGYGEQGFVQAGYPKLSSPSDEAFDIAAQYHPSWKYLKQGAKKLHARNSHILLGENLDDPVDFVICWTKDGKASGGTGQALRIAEDLKIEVYNLQDKNDWIMVDALVNNN